MFEPTGFSLQIFKERYAFTEQESFAEACHRVADQMARAETPDKQKTYADMFFSVLSENLFVPGGRIWYNSGRTNPQLLNCFVLNPEKDSREGWGRSAQDMIVTSMTGGGCGDDFSDVRPRGATITGQKGTAPGAVELMRLVDACAKPVKNGGQRRVALMFSLDLDHPDIEEFLNAKLAQGELTHANVSVRSKRTKEFIKAIKNDTDWELSWKGKYKRTVRARELWNTIVQNAYNSAEPGFLNWELVESESNIWYIEPLVTTNPCGEIALSAYDCCCLGHLVLPRFIKDGEMDFHMLGNTIRTAVRFLDNVLTVNNYPIPEMKAKSGNLRRIGLGTTGLADALATLGFRYGSTEGNKFIDKLYRFISKAAYESSVLLAVEKGMFPLCNPEKHVESGFMKRMPEKIKALVREHGIRNCAILTQAPTGCQRPDTLVTTDQGLLMLGELVDESGQTWQDISSINVFQESGITGMSKGFVNGVRETKRIRLNSGLELESTGNHQYRVFNSNGYIWKAAEDLSLGDKIVCKIGGYDKVTEVALKTNVETAHNVIHYTLPSQTSPELGWFLGLFFADGSVHEKGIRIGLNANEKSLNDGVAERIKNLFGLEVKRYIEDGVDNFYLNSKELLAYLKTNDLLKGECHQVEIPKAIRCASKATLAAFIDGYGWGDGHALTSNPKMTVYDTVSKNMAQQLIVALRALGRNTVTRIKTSGKTEGRYGTLPLYSVKEVSFGTFGQQQKERYLLKSRQADMVNARTLFEGAFLDEIVSIEDGFNMTLDIEVPKNYTYLANSVVSHNTVSILSGNCSSGIEPMFAPAYERRYWVGEERKKELVYHPLFAQFMRQGKNVDHFVGSQSLTVRDHLEVQAIVQKHVDNAVSKTVNIAEDCPVDEMEAAWMEYLPRLKGTTFYRENTRGFVNPKTGLLEEPPLKALTLDEATFKFWSETHIEDTETNDCASGACDIKFTK